MTIFDIDYNASDYKECSLSICIFTLESMNKSGRVYADI